MSEREIKVGSVWENGNGEVTVVTVDKDGDICLAEFGAFIDTGLFRATHRWVRDPEPGIKVGDWVEHIGPRIDRREVLAVSSKSYILGGPSLGPIEFTGTNNEVSRHDWRPCDPPPLHKALRELVEAIRAEQNVWGIAQRIADLYSKGER